MASTSSSSVQKRFKYDVFLSFRGEDTRKGFVDHLYHALQGKGINTYKDDEKIRKGERISEQLIKSIQDSRFYIIVFSKNYASSSWCLDELVKIMECQKMAEHTAYPVFYDVEPTQVRNQSGAVEEAFAKVIGKGKRKRTEEDADVEEKEAAGRWRDALKEAADLAGSELKTTYNGHEAKFIQQVVQEISRRLHFVNSSIDAKLVGMETRVKNVVSSLETGSDDVRMIGIKGIGGGGKTTLARAVFDLMSVWFEGKSFVENVREVSKGPGLKELQKQVLKDVLNDQSIDVTSVFDGIDKMKKRMCSVKALIVLDDVDNIEQLEALAGELTWFKSGSRIIITTRDQQVLVAHGVSIIYDANLLSDEEALCLFSRYAFKKEIPNLGYEDLSRQVVHYAAGLPLTIKVLGSHLRGSHHDIWEDAIERLKTIPEYETLKRLEVSYNGLENDQKEIFLEVVCILKGEKKDDAIRILNSCGYHAKFGLSVLEQKSLITISSYNCLSFHDRIEEMGWNIVQRSHPKEPSRHSRLWDKKEIEDILVNELGTKETRSIKLHFSKLDAATIMKGLRKMEELRLLYVKALRDYLKIAKFLGIEMDADVEDVEDVEDDEVSQYYLPDTLQSLCWHEYPFRSLPKTFKTNKLVNLKMHRSNIHELWKEGEKKVLNKLKFLDLCYSMEITTLDLRATPHLEELNLKECTNLVEFQLPDECLKLKILNLRGSKVSSIKLGLVPRLEELNLERCEHLVDFQLPVECLNLKILNLSGSKVSSIKLGLVPRLEELNLERCKHLVEFELPVECLNLKILKLSDSNVSSIKLGLVPRLEELNLARCEHLVEFQLPVECLNLKILNLSGGGIPQDLWRLQSLERLSLYCQQFRHLPDSICMLKHLKSLRLGSCSVLEKLPENICELECLEELNMSFCTSLGDIPDSICKMKCLKSLYLYGCRNIKKLPENICELECLEVLNMWCESLPDIPDSICKMKCLKSLNLRGCDSIKKLPENICELECLEVLNMWCESLPDIPDSICKMKCLKSLNLRGCESLGELWQV